MKGYQISDSHNITLDKDSRWISELKKDCPAALEALFHLYKDRVYAFSFKILKTKDLADDVVIEVFTKIWEKRASIDQTRSFECLLFTITRNHTLNLLKKMDRDEHHQVNMQVKPSPSSSPTENEVIYNDYLNKANLAIDKMPPQRRRAFKLKNEQGLTYDQIALQLGVSRNTVKSHLKAATAELKTYLNSLI